MARRWLLLGTACAALLTPTALIAPVHAGESDPVAGAAPTAGPDLTGSTSDADLPGASMPSARSWAGQDARPPANSTRTEPRLETTRQQRPVAPGVTLESFDAYGADPFSGTPNWLRGDSLTVDLEAGTTVDYLFPGRVADGAPVSEMAKDAGAVAAVNGDFFDINRSNAPMGVGVRDSEPVQSPDATDDSWQSSVAMITPDGLGQIGEVFFSGTVDLPGDPPARATGEGDLELAGLNKPYAAENQVHAYTPLWGSHCRCTATEDAEQVTEVEVVDDTVTAVRDRATDRPIPADGFVLVGREAGAKSLASLRKGDPVSIDYRIRGPEQTELHAAINGRQPLVLDGEPVASSDDDNATHPRTAVGFSSDGSEMYLLTVDGRQPAFATGVGLDELAAMMIDLGAHNAINLDGGGSTTIVAREPGSDRLPVQNSPSDGEERLDPNGLGLFAPEGSGRVRDIWVRTSLDPRRASGAQDIAPARTERVFPGFDRALTANGYDETFGPAEADSRWDTSRPRVGEVDRSGVFHAQRTGETNAVASDGKARGQLRLTVLDQLERLAASTDQVALAGAEDAATFSILGYDEHGHAAPFEPGELSLSYDRELVDIEQTKAGTFRVTARGDDGNTMVTVDAGGVETVLPVTVGLEQVTVADFEDASDWEFFGERAEGSIESAPGRTGNGLRLRYDFTASNQTRTGGIVPSGELPIPGEPQAFGLWVKSTGNGEWPSLQVRDATGASVAAMRADHLTGTGWQRLEFTVPEDVVYPLAFERYYSAEIEADRQYQGDLVLDDLTALVPPEVDPPEHRTTTDRDTGTAERNGSTTVEEPAPKRGQDWSFAALSDARVSVPGPGDKRAREAAEQLRRTLRDIRASDADLLVLNGDLVNEGSAANLGFLRRLLADELGDELPYVYLPGERERAGDGSLDAFRRVFGDTSRVLDHQGTRFVGLDTSGGSLRDSDWRQLPRLREQLDRAAKDRQVRSVVVISHRPMVDPDPYGIDGLVDRKEAITITEWLADFRRETGKGTALLGAHAGEFQATSVEGVPSFVTGNAIPSEQPGRAAQAEAVQAAPPDAGWSLLRAERVRPGDAAEVRRAPWRGGPDWIESTVRGPATEPATGSHR